MKTGVVHQEVLEKQLLISIASGDQKAFAVLFETYQTMIYDYSLRLTRSKTQAEEIVQKIFMKIWIKRAELEKIENFGAYLNRATRNESYTALRAIAAQVVCAIEPAHESFAGDENTEHRVLYNESAGMLKAAVASLPPQRKLVYELCHEQGLKYEEAAKLLNISSGTVHKHMKLALKTIREHFGRISMLLLITGYFHK